MSTNSSQFKQHLHDKLPESIRTSKQIIVVNDGDIPPYIIYDSEHKMAGASVDFLTAISEILGVEIKNERVSGLPALLMGIQNNRYDMAIGPVGDTPARQKKSDFIDYAASYVAFAVAKGNPANINNPGDTCGKRIAFAAGGNAEEKLIHYSDTCVKEGKPTVDIQSYRDQSGAILALKSGRVDAFYHGAPLLAYYVQQAKDEIELAGTRTIDSLPERYHAAMVPKDSELGPVLLEAFQEMFNNGSYINIMKKWGLESNALTAPGINLAK